MKGHILFAVFLVIFVVSTTFALTGACGWIPIKEPYLKSLFGVFVIQVGLFVLRYFRKTHSSVPTKHQEKQTRHLNHENNDAKPENELTEIGQKILILISSIGTVPVGYLRQETQMSEELLRHHLETLFSAGMVGQPSLDHRLQQAAFSLTSHGRAYLAERGLLK